MAKKKKDKQVEQTIIIEDNYSKYKKEWFEKAKKAGYNVFLENGIIMIRDKNIFEPENDTIKNVRKLFSNYKGSYGITTKQKTNITEM